MRYRFLDEIVAFSLEPPRVEVAKTFPWGDDAVSGPAGPDRVPVSLLLELLATAGGVLAARRLGGRRLPLLAKVPECRFDRPAAPGRRLVARVELTGLMGEGPTVLAEAAGEVRADGELVATARLLYACVTVEGVDLAAAYPA